jgi:hypothetical protein
LSSITTTLRFKVEGDSYQELLEAAETSIRKFVNSDDEDDEDYELDEEPYESVSSTPRVSYELVVEENCDMSSEHQYTAEVIARLKDDNR